MSRIELHKNNHQLYKFSEVLNELTKRICYNHPYHCLPLVITLLEGEESKNDKNIRYQAVTNLYNYLTEHYSTILNELRVFNNIK